jgi:hypothetical protein
MRYLMIFSSCLLVAACDGQLSRVPTGPSTAATAIETQHSKGAAPVVEVTFTKWITTFPMMAGRTAGDVVGTYAGEVLNRTAFDNGVIVKLEARYQVIDPSGLHSFTALIQGTQNNGTGKAVLNGVITEGWRVGAQVHVTFQVVTPCELGTRNVCYQGSIRVMPGSAE